MPGVFVETVRIQNFGCVKDARLELTRLHALIGPNDSGKSTVLGAIRTEAELLQWGEQILQEAGRLDPRGMPGTTITMRSPAATIACGRDDGGWGIDIDGEVRPAWRLDHPSWLQGRIELASPARGATVVRWDPDAMRRPCELIPDGRPLTIGEKGEGIPAIYEAILSRDRQAFDAIEAGVRHHFPTVKAIWLPTSIESKKALGVTLTDGTRVHADVMSEGLLYWLAFAILPHVAQNAFLLIEEPENGLHPSRIAEVMKALRALSQHVQVVLATHSPLVINELEPEEVTLITRDSNSGTRATRIDRTSHFRQRNKVYALGELWLSFADGDSEAALVPADDSSHVAG
ncbi:MAG: AAA family ATPase [Kofleriaceae bacterium]